MINKDIVQEMVNFISRSPSSYHAVENIININKENGFEEIDSSEDFIIQNNKKYLFRIGVNGVVSMLTPEKITKKTKFRFIFTHCDFPTLKIKPESTILFEDRYAKINTEVYGGAILYSYFDKALSIAGKIFYVDQNDKILSKLIDFEKPVAVIPSLPIHLNREVNNKGLEIKPQKDMLPILATSEPIKDKDFFKNLLEKKVDGKILSYDLNFYDCNENRIIGLDDNLVYSSRLDNLSLFYLANFALIETKNSYEDFLVTVSFNSEEVGSLTIDGADSVTLTYLLERVFYSFLKENENMEDKKGLGFLEKPDKKNNKISEREQFLRIIGNSIFLSGDLSHGVNPNNPDKFDPLTHNYLNNGFTIKYNFNQNYVTDADFISKVIYICEKNNIKYQKYCNNSDIKGGGTVGPIVNSRMNIKGIDIGCPVLAMHSIKEVGGKDDFEAIYRFFKLFLVDAIF